VFTHLPKVPDSLKTIFGNFLGNLANAGPVRLECQKNGHLAQLQGMEQIDGIRRATNNLSVPYEEIEEAAEQVEDELAKWAKYFDERVEQDAIRSEIAEPPKEPTPVPEVQVQPPKEEKKPKETKKPKEEPKKEEPKKEEPKKEEPKKEEPKKEEPKKDEPKKDEPKKRNQKNLKKIQNQKRKRNQKKNQRNPKMK